MVFISVFEPCLGRAMQRRSEQIKVEHQGSAGREAYVRASRSRAGMGKAKRAGWAVHDRQGQNR